MNKLFCVLAALALVGSISALGIDAAVGQMFNYCSVIDHEGDQILITKQGFDNEADAYDWVAGCASVILAIRAGWEEAPSSYAAQIAGLDAIAAIWATQYQTFVVSIPVWEILVNFNDSGYLESGIEELMADLSAYIDYYGDVSPYSMY